MGTLPLQTPGGERSSPDLPREIQQIYRLVLVALTSLLFLGLGTNVFFFKQFQSARAQLAATRTVVENLSAQYGQKEPAMRQFVAALQTFAARHPDFQPTLQRYRRALPRFFVEPTATLSNQVPVRPTGRQ